MSEQTPTRGLALQLREEQRTMREGYAFLDEKCLLLAGEMLRQLKQYRALQAQLQQESDAARTGLRAALQRHGLNGLQVYPAADGRFDIQTEQRSLLGVPLLAATLAAVEPVAPPAVRPTAEAQVCRALFAALVRTGAQLAAVSGNLARLHAEYRKTVRRVRALQDVLLPEVEQTLRDLETSLEELEQDESVVLRRAIGR